MATYSPASPENPLGSVTNGIKMPATTEPASSEADVKSQVEELRRQLRAAVDAKSAAEERSRKAAAKVAKLLEEQQLIVAFAVSQISNFANEFMRKLVPLLSRNLESQQSQVSCNATNPSANVNVDLNWLTVTEPKYFPYFPQVDDVLIYIRQAHELYIEAVRKGNICNVYQEEVNSLPYVQFPDFPAHTLVRLAHVKFELKAGVPLANLWLEGIDKASGADVGIGFDLCYCPVKNVSDFLVLRGLYDRSLLRKWTPGERFQCSVYDPECQGTVVAENPLDWDYPESVFKRYLVMWDIDDPSKPRRMSPWEMVPVSQPPPNPYEDLSVEWMSECRRISASLKDVTSLLICAQFERYNGPAASTPVAYPMDLHTIEERLVKYFYRRKEALLTDVDRFIIDAEKLYPGHGTRINAKIVTNLLRGIIDNVYGNGINGRKDRQTSEFPTTTGRNCADEDALTDRFYENEENDDWETEYYDLKY